MKRTGIWFLSVLAGLLTFILLSAIAELILSPLSPLAILSGIFVGFYTHKKLMKRFDFAPVKETNKETFINYGLYTLLILEILFSFLFLGADEYTDIMAGGFILCLFFVLELYFLFKTKLRNGPTALITLALLATVFSYLIFLDTEQLISNKFTLEEYSEVWGYVFAMFFARAGLDLIKLLILHRDMIKTHVYSKHFLKFDSSHVSE